jgi:hypothetical protein
MQKGNRRNHPEERSIRFGIPKRKMQMSIEIALRWTLNFLDQLATNSNNQNEKPSTNVVSCQHASVFSIDGRWTST